MFFIVKSKVLLDRRGSISYSTGKIMSTIFVPFYKRLHVKLTVTPNVEMVFLSKANDLSSRAWHFPSNDLNDDKSLVESMTSCRSPK